MGDGNDQGSGVTTGDWSKAPTPVMPKQSSGEDDKEIIKESLAGDGEISKTLPLDLLDAEPTTQGLPPLSGVPPLPEAPAGLLSGPPP